MMLAERNKSSAAYTEAISERLEEESGAGAVRMKRPGMAYTLEYRADRASVDEAEIIQTIQCG
ncbi:I78 family peptidase inhibitor [Aidingimonas lacisalsi]|uniref:I78 family peptidase inhibitor n=1 Tax=Aidingimonas lacisalsi TaxID=2604086 RepID=UPI0011D2AE2B